MVRETERAAHGELVCDELRDAAARLDRVVADIVALAESLDHEAFNARVDEKSWSVGQCIAHLTSTADPLIAPLNEKIAAARTADESAYGPFRYGWFGRKFRHMSSADTRSKKVSTPKKFAPASNVDRNTTLDDFCRTHETFGETIRAADGVDIANVKLRSAAAPILRFPIGIWLTMIPMHAERHFEQAREVAEHVMRNR